ncbi:hypothetical protein OPQ81_008700 [Rhizoctonia solani]|nr:hypothetical protein OPQ81_008700 [Rhizoctonia solani]
MGTPDPSCSPHHSPRLSLDPLSTSLQPELGSYIMGRSIPATQEAPSDRRGLSRHFLELIWNDRHSC